MQKPELHQQSNIQPIDFQMYRHYLPSAFDDTLSYLEKLNKVIWKLNELGELTNEMIDKWNKVIEWVIGDGLTEAVENQLQRWKEDGTLEQIINDKIFDDLQNRIDELKKEVEKIVSDLETFKTKIQNDIENFKDDAINDINSLMPKSNGAAYQKKQMKLFTGMGGDAVFPGAEKANQGMAYIRHNGKEKIFIVSRVEGGSWESQERQRIIEYEFTNNGGEVNPTTYSQVIDIGHQGISAYIENDQIVLITAANTGGGIENAKGYAKVFWNGSQTGPADVKTYQLFGKTGSNHPLEMFNHGTPAITFDGKYIAIAAASTYPGGMRYCLVFDRESVEAAANPLDVEPLNIFRIVPPAFEWGNVIQDIAIDGSFIYFATGNPSADKPNMLTIHQVNGIYEGYYKVDGSIGDYTLNELKGNTTEGNPTQLEPEGLAIRDNNLLFETTDVWKDNAGGYLKRDKVVHEITRDPASGTPINRGWQNLEPSSSLNLYGAPNDISFPKGEALQVSIWDAENETFREAFGYHGQQGLWIYDVRDGSHHDQHITLQPYFNDGAQYTIFRADRSNDNGAGFNAHRKDSSSPGRFSIHFGQGTSVGEHRIYFYVSTNNNPKLAPNKDNVVDLGTPNDRFQNIYAGNGNITTSDERDKTDIKAISDDVLDAWADIAYKQYRFKDAKQAKGDKARYHMGLIAQDIIRVFNEHGLNAFDYGLVGYDEWDETPERQTEDGEIEQEYQAAGNKYSIRADECLMLESALLRRELQKLKG